MNELTITIKFIGPYADDICDECIEEKVRVGFTVQELKDLLAERYAPLRKGYGSKIDQPVISVDGKVVVDTSTQLCNGAEVWVIPPVGGG